MSSMNDKRNWQEKVEEYCYKYNIPSYYLSETMYEPKVIPMIRGKAFEFSVMVALQKILPSKDWEVKKVPMNAQQGLHDVDVLVINKKTGKKLSIECKLSAKGSYKRSDQTSSIKVKCMRSRTLGAAMVKSLAPKLGVTEKQLMVHNDQYVVSDFDLVVTSIANAFYETDQQTKIFEWQPSKEGEEFLRSLSTKEIKDLKDFAFNQMYIATSKSLSICKKNKIVCTRKKCTQKENCNFIPNYPLITFSNKTKTPTKDWIPLSDSESFFNDLIGK